MQRPLPFQSPQLHFRTLERFFEFEDAAFLRRDGGEEGGVGGAGGFGEGFRADGEGGCRRVAGGRAGEAGRAGEDLTRGMDGEGGGEAVETVGGDVRYSGGGRGGIAGNGHAAGVGVEVGA